MRILISEMEGVRVVRAEGELDARSAGEFQQALERAGGETEGPTPDLVIDMEACTYVDSAGIGVLFAAVGLARQRGGRVAAVRPSAQVLRILQLVRLTDERGFKIFSDLECIQAVPPET